MKMRYKAYDIGHFINEPDKRTDFEITRFEEMEEPDVTDPHQHRFYEIMWTDEGSSLQVIDYRAYQIAGCSLFFISPGQLHHFEEWQSVKGGTIMFSADFFGAQATEQHLLLEMSFLDNFYADACIRPEPEAYREMRGVIDQLYKESRKTPRNEGICRAYLQILLTMVQQQQNGAGMAVKSRYMILYKQFRALLEQQFAGGLSATHYAQQLYVTTHHLNHVVKHITTKTVTKVIRERVMLEARRLLTFSDLSVTEIASKLGYVDTSYFARVFRSVVGTAPLAFRSSISEKYRKL